jgi:CRISPR/Cas system-associated exonuclease Cas4 (RecB family)
VARRNPDGTYTIAAGEVSVFSVCPQSWHLKWNERETGSVTTSQSALGQRLHKDWAQFFEESLKLSNWIRYLVILVCAMILVFMAVSSSRAPLQELFQLSWRNKGLQMVLLASAALWVIRSFGKEALRRHEGAGFSPSDVTLAIDGSSMLPDREYVSIRQGLAGRPDALIRENGNVIPVERKPLAKKLRDRYVVQMLIYLRLVEEFEDTRPPHGYLLLGPRCRRVKIVNSETKQLWVSGLLAEMRRILEGGAPIPAPHPMKCAKCDVRERCSARQDVGQRASGPAVTP